MGRPPDHCQTLPGSTIALSTIVWKNIKQQQQRQPATCLPTVATYTHEQDLLVMGAGGTFLRVLATGTLAVVMAAVPPPPDPKCDVPEVIIQKGKPTDIVSSETLPTTLYLHSSEPFDALRIFVTSDEGPGVMWVPFIPACFQHVKEGWIETISYCTVDLEVGLVMCGFNASFCKFMCYHALLSPEEMYFDVTVYGRSLWRSTAPPQGCKVNNITTDTDSEVNIIYCFDDLFDTSTPPMKGTPPPTAGAPPLISAASNRKRSGVEAQVAAVVQEG